MSPQAVAVFPTDPSSHRRIHPRFDLDLDLSRGVIRPSADLDRNTTPIVLTAIQALRAERPGDLILDLSSVGAICVEGLDAIVAIARAQKSMNRALRLVNATTAVKRILLAAGLAAYIDS